MNEEVLIGQAIRAQWVQRAIVLAWISVAYNLVEDGLSVAFSWADRSVAECAICMDQSYSNGEKL